MNDKKGFNNNQIKEVIINAFVFAVQLIIFYKVEENKLFSALATMAALFSLYTIPLSKSDVKSTIIGSLSVNIITSIFFVTYYFNINNILFTLVWTSLMLWFIYKLIKKFKLK